MRILGGGEIAVERLGRRPSTWDVLEFGAEQPARLPAYARFLRLLPRPGPGRGVRPDHPRGDGGRRAGDHRRALPGHLRRRRALHRPGRGTRPRARAARTTASGTGPWSSGARAFVEQRFGSASHVSRLRLGLSRPSLRLGFAGAVRAAARTARRHGPGAAGRRRSGPAPGRRPPARRTDLKPVLVTGSEPATRRPACWSSICPRSA